MLAILSNCELLPISFLGITQREISNKNDAVGSKTELSNLGRSNDALNGTSIY